MKYWEFLIQKEGDQNWLLLGTHRTDLLEGRYRVVAHTHHTHSPINIRVSQQVPTETSLRKQVFNRTDHTNDAGLAVIIPYTYLQPGQWEITCSGPNTTGSLNDWQYSLQMQVFAPTEERWRSDWPNLAGDQSEAVDKSLLFGLAATVNPDLPLIHAQSQLRAQSPDTRLAGETEGYEISLSQSAFLAQNDQPISIIGQVRSLFDPSAAQAKSQLCIRLQESETTQVIMEAHRPINLARLPAGFKVKFQLPKQVTTRIILGEVSLYSDPPKRATLAMLCSAAFTITAGIAHLLDDTANRALDSRHLADSDEETSIAHQPEDANHADDAHLEKDQLPLVALPLFAGPQNVSPAVGVIPPPHIDQLAYTNLTEQIDLPSFPRSNLLIVSDPQQSHSPQDSHATVAGSLDTIASNLNGIKPSLDSSLDLDLDKVNSNESDLDEPSDESLDQPLDQPNLDKSTSSHSIQRPPMVAKPARFIGTSIVDDDLEATEITALLADMNDDLDPVVPLANASSPSATSFLSDTPEPSSDLIDEAESFPVDSKSAAPDQTQTRTVKTAFKALKLRDRFIQRLSDLTHDEMSQSPIAAEAVHSADVSLENSQAY